jgi:hypothetical protein
MGGDFLPVMFAGFLIDDSVIALITNAFYCVSLIRFRRLQEYSTGIPKAFLLL